MFNKTMIAKYTVTTIIASAVQSAVITVVTNNTEKTEDDNIVTIPAAVVGYAVANALRDRTNAMVDGTVAKIQNFKNRKDTTE